MWVNIKNKNCICDDFPKTKILLFVFQMYLCIIGLSQTFFSCNEIFFSNKSLKIVSFYECAFFVVGF